MPPEIAAAHRHDSQGETLGSDDVPRLRREALSEAGTRQRWTPGAVLLREGAHSDHVLLLEAGEVKVTSSAASGKQTLLAIRGPGDLLGEFSAIDGRPRSASVTAISAVTAIIVPGKAFRDLLIGDGAATFHLLQLVVGRLREADVQRLDFGAYTVTERLARLLLDYADRYGRTAGDGVLITLSLSQTELAEAANASREMVAKALRRLRELGAVRTGRRRIELLRPDILVELAGNLPSVHSDADRDPHHR